MLVLKRESMSKWSKASGDDYFYQVPLVYCDSRKVIITKPSFMILLIRNDPISVPGVNILCFSGLFPMHRSAVWIQNTKWTSSPVESWSNPVTMKDGAAVNQSAGEIWSHFLSGHKSQTSKLNWYAHEETPDLDSQVFISHIDRSQRGVQRTGIEHIVQPYNQKIRIEHRSRKVRTLIVGSTANIHANFASISPGNVLLRG